MTAAEISTIRITDTEIAAWAFRHIADVRDEMREHIWHRLRVAFDAAADGQARYSERET
jgi:hypothetical protein